MSEWIRAAEQQGWRVRSGSKHRAILYPPDGGRPIPLPHRIKTHGTTIANTVASLRRRGLKLPD